MFALSLLLELNDSVVYSCYDLLPSSQKDVAWHPIHKNITQIPLAGKHGLNWQEATYSPSFIPLVFPDLARVVSNMQCTLSCYLYKFWVILISKLYLALRPYAPVMIWKPANWNLPKDAQLPKFDPPFVESKSSDYISSHPTTSLPSHYLFLFSFI